jgi:hypothetical protein
MTVVSTFVGVVGSARRTGVCSILHQVRRPRFTNAAGMAVAPGGRIAKGTTGFKLLRGGFPCESID